MSLIKLVSLAAVISFMVMFASGFTSTIAPSPPFAPVKVMLCTLRTPVSQLWSGRNFPYVQPTFPECMKEAIFVAVFVLIKPVLLPDTPELLVYETEKYTFHRYGYCATTNICTPAPSVYLGSVTVLSVL